ncbi:MULTISPECIES: HNH endonuclease family protein [Micromonospora]|uniref:HNH endonuclease n=1 Tax=Micromonospora solifontis TaxID=2487138 RepID=A0ABX9W9C5_9ACTN|nr:MULTISPECIES: HNH endonuclease family protein [Micromonospora]NES13101.1 HNH endonuclease [Micromonospora sp. PPF5-17B]NES39353.1 HNH endonuclease [Micromonospora solifontis]NES55026.1 HNH endonuclease [Micromonospora sp. PPF5-6]RNL89302.1 HNH endonuclease [Micromonospora solifontis]
MNRTLRVTAISLAAILAATLGLTQPARAAGYSASLTTAVAGLPVATEVRTGYSRDLFPHWIDADHDGCNTRNEVLLAEAVSAPTVSGTCTLSGGRWYSYYDNAYWTLTGDLDIDHMVPLAEAWDSGARNWTTSRRQAYANDLGDSRALAAVTDNVNQAKGDQDPATWLPPYASARCRYVDEWVAVKIRWRLTVDSAEKSALTSWANNCPNVTISVTYAY